MSLTSLQEMLELSEASALDALKAGYNGGKPGFKSGKAAMDQLIKNHDADTDAAEKEDEQEVEKAKKAAEKAKKAGADQASVDLQDDLAQFVADFFTKFPNYQAGTAEQLKKRYPTQEARNAAGAAFKGVATRIEALRQGLNRSAVSSRIATSDQVRKFNNQAKKMMGSNAPAPHSSLINFVKHEAAFFKRLIRIKNNGELNSEDFKQVLELKLKQTDPTRKPDAVQALNLLFAYTYSQFNAHARVIADATSDAEDAERQERLNRRQPAA